MKKLFLIIMMILIILMCTACGKQYQFPQVRLMPTCIRSDHIYIPLREGYEFAEVPFGIIESDDGWYNITIYCVRKQE